MGRSGAHLLYGMTPEPNIHVYVCAILKMHYLGAVVQVEVMLLQYKEKAIDVIILWAFRKTKVKEQHWGNGGRENQTF